MQIVDDGAPAQIEKILAWTTISCAPSLPVANVGEGVLNRYPLAEFAATFWSLLASA